jgi:glycine cleavage system H protein
LKEVMMEFPADLKYTKNDEWVRVEGNIGTVGITDYAQDQLSDIIFMEITAEIGEQLEKDAAVAEVESVKAAAFIYMPVGGVIIETNEELFDTPEIINADPYGAAWMFKFEITNPVELDDLLDATAYEKYCQEREH